MSLFNQKKSPARFPLSSPSPASPSFRPLLSCLLRFASSNSRHTLVSPPLTLILILLHRSSRFFFSHFIFRHVFPLASARFNQSSLSRPRPFDFQRFISDQTRILKMSNAEEKARTSGETSRPEPSLPTVNPAAEKSEPPKPTFHPAVYVT